MRKRRKTTQKVGLVLLIFAGLAMTFLPLPLWAQDFDNDGILDNEEGDCLPQGTPCENPTSANIPDLFVIRNISPSDGESLLPPEPFEFITTTVNPFEINLHEIDIKDWPSTTTDISTTQKAIVLIEDLRTSDGDLGTSLIGVPSSGVFGRVYSNRILEDVRNACSLQPECEAMNSNRVVVANGEDEIFKFYAKNVVAHETFHMLNRVVPPNIDVDFHYPQLGYIMDHHMYYKVKARKGLVRWFITDEWAAEDRPQFK